MALQMARPTPHPKTGVYRIRLAVPAHLRDSAKAVCGTSHELIASLGTKDAKEAHRAAPTALAGLHAKMEAIRAAHEGSAVELPEQAVQALAGRYYSQLTERWAADPGPASRWQAEQDYILDQCQIGSVERSDPTAPEQVEFKTIALAEDKPTAKALLEKAGYASLPQNVERVASAICLARFQFAQAMERRASGDWTPDHTPDQFPPLPQGKATAPIVQPDTMPFDTLLNGWAMDKGHASKPGEKPKRSYYDREKTINRLGAFLGHKDANRVTKADAVRWKEDMQARGLKVPTIRNDLSEMSAIWKWAVKNEKATANPFEGISPLKPKRRAPTKRAFTQDEAKAILTAARDKTGLLRWLPWVCCFTGARLTEVCQSSKADVMVMDGVHVLRIHDQGEDDEVRSIKNEDSRRDVPIHPALIAEGFLKYVSELRDGSPLFPDAKPDKVFGQRGIEAGRKVSRWLKKDLKITDPTISPNHSWRHWFIGACRGVQMHPEVRSALSGHSAKMDESAQYGAGMRSFIKVLAEALAKVPSPLGSARPGSESRGRPRK